jgi:hypothetical protein
MANQPTPRIAFEPVLAAAPPHLVLVNFHKLTMNQALAVAMLMVIHRGPVAVLASRGNRAIAAFWV